MQNLNKANALKLLGILTICSSITIGAYMLSAKDVTITIDDEIREVTTYSKLSRTFLKKRKYHLARMTI